MVLTTQRATTQALRAPGKRESVSVRGMGRIGSLQGTVTPDGRRWTAAQTSFDPEQQVEQTIPLIRSYVQADSQHPYMRSLALRAPGLSAAEKGWYAAKQHLEFMNDQDVARLAGVDTGDDVIEVLQRPIDVAMQYRMTGERVKGDCDDFVMFATAVAKAYDPDCDARYVCVAAEAAAPGVLSHIYCTIDDIPCDASHGEYPGWEVPRERITRRVEFALASELPLMAFVISAVWFFLTQTIPGKSLTRRLTA